MKLNLEVKSIVLIPGSGEFVYEIDLIKKNNIAINYDNKNISDVKQAINNLKSEFPNVKDIMISISWFASSLNARDAKILPLAEHNHKNNVKPLDWLVGNYNRENASVVCKNKYGVLSSGGTPSDKSIMDLAKYLYESNYKVSFMPLLLVNTPDKPWRGNIVPSSEEDIELFFQQNGYNDYIMHYASLSNTKEKFTDFLESFLIGSELVKLTTYRDFGQNDFKGVNNLINLANKVREIAGSELKISYSANWGDEYHHTSGGLYALDNLWCSDNIDFIGISSYFPLTENLPQDEINQQKIFEGFSSGEGWDYYIQYDTPAKKIYFNDSAYAWKNFEYWWSNHHFEGGKKTCFIPKEKPIWITEFGFASKDETANHPYCYNKDKAIINNNAQHEGICASLLYYKSKEHIIEKSFLYAFDARPYHKFHDSKIWSDSIEFDTGHWFNDKDISEFECIVSKNNHHFDDL